MKKLLGIVVLGLLFCNVSYAWKITSWKVVKVIEEGIYLDSNSVIGQIQYFGSGGKGKNEGIFYNCPFWGGQVTGGHTYTEEEFFKNKEFDLFKKNRDKLNFPKGQKILVEKKTCAENRSVLYPFIQFEDSDVGYYQFDMGIYELEDIYK